MSTRTIAMMLFSFDYIMVTLVIYPPNTQAVGVLSSIEMTTTYKHYII